MAATSTSFGSGAFGIGNDESGVIIDNISFNFVNDRKEIKNRTGNTVGVTFYNERCEISFGGGIPASGAFSSTIAAALVLQNTMPSHLAGGVAGGKILIDEVSIEHGAEDYRTIEVNATYWPNIA